MANVTSLPAGLTLSWVPEPLRVASEDTEFRHIRQLRQREFGRLYPAVVHTADDIHDAQACVLYGQSLTGRFTSTGRMVFDGPQGLPADALVRPEIDRLRNQGLVVAESGKFVITREAGNMLRFYLHTYLELAQSCGVDSIIFIIRAKNVDLYRTTTCSRVLLADIGYHYGTSFRFALLECRVKEAAPTYRHYWGRNAHVA
ncbi:MAG: hypothetical protein KDI15_02520 [Thiothrix sp.]|nr:hypothetical protein [Thiothrix sp.]HPE60755.1 hypothetical protein [Thiolinea sp.]